MSRALSPLAHKVRFCSGLLVLLGAAGCGSGGAEPVKQGLTGVGVAASSAIDGSREALTTVGETSEAALSTAGEALETLGLTAIRAKALAGDAARALSPPQTGSPLDPDRGAVTGAPKVYAPTP